MSGGDPQDLDARVTFNTRLRRRTKAALELAATSGITMQDLTEAAIVAYLERHFHGVVSAVGDREKEEAVAMQLFARRNAAQAAARAAAMTARAQMS